MDSFAIGLFRSTICWAWSTAFKSVDTGCFACCFWNLPCQCRILVQSWCLYHLLAACYFLFTFFFQPIPCSPLTSPSTLWEMIVLMSFISLFSTQFLEQSRKWDLFWSYYSYSKCFCHYQWSRQPLMREAKFTCSGIVLGSRLLGGGVVPRGWQTGCLQLYFGSREEMVEQMTSSMLAPFCWPCLRLVCPRFLKLNCIPPCCAAQHFLPWGLEKKAL